MMDDEMAEDDDMMDDEMAEDDDMMDDDDGQRWTMTWTTT